MVYDTNDAEARADNAEAERMAEKSRADSAEARLARYVAKYGEL